MLDLPHASTVSGRLRELLQPEAGRAYRASGEVFSALIGARFEEPTGEAAEEMRQSALTALRALVDVVERKECGTDRIGQRVRNLFELLDEAEEGLRASLRAGENPGSAMRP